MARVSPQAASACTFTDTIPPEIRRQIFSNLLIRDDEIRFRARSTGNTAGLRETQWIIDTRRPRSERWSEAQDEDVQTKIKTRHFTAIIQTCKLFAQEASDVLYSCNVFRLTNLRGAGGYLSEPGGYKCAIRHIVLDRFEGGTMLVQGFWSRLLPLVNLRTLNLPHGVICKAHRSTLAMRALRYRILPLLKSIRKGTTDSGRSFDPIEVLQTPRQLCPACYLDAEGESVWGDRRYRENLQYITALNEVMLTAVKDSLRQALAEANIDIHGCVLLEVSLTDASRKHTAETGQYRLDAIKSIREQPMEDQALQAWSWPPTSSCEVSEKHDDLWGDVGGQAARQDGVALHSMPWIIDVAKPLKRSRARPEPSRMLNRNLAGSARTYFTRPTDVLIPHARSSDP